MKKYNLTGMQFSNLKVIKYLPDELKWVCECSCGNIKHVRASHLINGNNKSCGCLNYRSRDNTQLRTHGLSNTPIYRTYHSMIQRSTPGSAYQIRQPTYIGVGRFPAWDTFEGFMEHQPHGPPYFTGCVLSRIGDVGDYTPENCRYISFSQNAIEAALKRKVRTSDGRIMFEVASENGIKHTTVSTRLSRGWTPDEACGLVPRAKKLKHNFPKNI
jgi:hypothetical protein